MFSFNSEGGIPVAKIIGGKYHDKIVYLIPDHNNGGESKSINKNQCKYCEKPFARRDVLNKHLESRACKGLVAKKLIDEYHSRLGNNFEELNLKDGKFQIVPHLNERMVGSISGPSGSGKTRFVDDWINNSKKKDVYLFSPIVDDKSIKNKKIKQIALDNNLLEEGLDAKDFDNSVVIFDDIQSIKQPYRDMIDQLMLDILTTGRHYNIDILCTSHKNTAYKDKTKTDLLNEAKAYVIFPAASSKNQLKNLLCNYANFDNKSLQEILKVPSRWIYIYRNFPGFYVAENKLGMIKNLG